MNTVVRKTPINRRSFTIQIASILFAVAIAFTTANTAFAKEDSPATVAGATTVDTAAAKNLHDEGAIFVDVRSQMRWDAGRVPGAAFIPIEEFSDKSLGEYATKDQKVVIYCQGIKCLRSAKACEKAIAWGYANVFYYREGYPGWSAAGHEIE